MVSEKEIIYRRDAEGAEKTFSDYPELRQTEAG